MKAGETIESFAQRVGCSSSEIRSLNHFPGGVPQAGQSIVVPERCVHPADANNQVSASLERVRGNAAEQNRLNGQMNQFSKVRTWPGTPGRYHSYEEVAMEALQKEVKEGTIDASLLKDKNFIRDFANKIKQMNNNANVETLGTIKVPVTERMNSNMDVRQNDKGKSLSQMKEDLTRTSAALFGPENDIGSVVADYVDSQQKDGAAIKTVTKIAGTALVMAVTGGAGGILIGAATVAAGTVAVDVTVDLSDNAYSQIVNGGDPLTYDQIEDIITNAFQDGVVTGLTFGIGRYVKSLTSLNNLGKAGIEITGKTVVGSGKDLITKGQVSIEGVLFNVVYSSAGKLVSLKPVLSKVGINGNTATVVNQTAMNTAKTELKDSIGVNTSETVEVDADS